MSKRNYRITLKDIAQETGFTINTVSRALKEKTDISESTRIKIQEAAKQMGYIQDAVAGSMRSGITRTIAVILSDISNPYLAIQVKAIEMTAAQYGYSTFILNTDEDSSREYQAILSAYGKKVDGMLICPVQENEDNVRFLKKTGLPFVLIGRHFKNLKTDAVYSDDLKGGFLAADYLLSQGHRKILYLGGPNYISSGEERLKGFREAYSKANIPLDEKYIRIVDVRTGAGRRIVSEVLSEKLDFSAVVAFSDMLGMEVKSTLLELHGREALSIPIIGFDNIQSRLLLPFEFSSIGMVSGEWAKQAVDLLFQRIQSHNTDEPCQNIVLDVKLVHYFNNGIFSNKVW